MLWRGDGAKPEEEPIMEEDDGLDDHVRRGAPFGEAVPMLPCRPRPLRDDESRPPKQLRL